MSPVPRLRSLAAVVMLAGATGVPGGAQEALVRWEIVGVTGEMLTNVLATTAPTRALSASSEGEVRALADRVTRLSEAALEPLGYYEATGRAEIRGESPRWTVNLSIAPGEPVRVTRWDVRLSSEGESDVALRGVVQRHRIEAGAVLSHPAYEALKTELANVAAARGYLDARVDTAVIRIDRSARSAEVVLRFETGPRFRLGPARFLQDAVHPGLLADLVPWEVGEPYDAALLLALQNELTQGPYFASVEVAPRRDLAEDGVVPIDVRLTPAPRERYSVGAGYASDTGPRGTLLAEFRRLNLAGHRAEIDTRVATVEVRAAARYVIPIRAPGGSLLTLSTAYADLHPATSDTETWLVGANVAGLLGGFRSEVGVTLQRASYDVADQSGITRLLFVGAGVSRVRADDRIAPERGSLVRVRARVGEEGALSDVSVREIALETRLVISPSPRVRLRARGEAGILNASDFDRLPGSIRYFAGGDRSVRGFDYHELGPTNEEGAVIGGSRLLVIGGEAEWRLHPRLGVATFMDVGNALFSFSDELERGAGGGVRWLSPAGMVRVDAAFAISRPGAPFRLHLSLGPEL